MRRGNAVEVRILPEIIGPDAAETSPATASERSQEGSGEVVTASARLHPTSTRGHGLSTLCLCPRAIHRPWQNTLATCRNEEKYREDPCRQETKRSPEHQSEKLGGPRVNKKFHSCCRANVCQVVSLTIRSERPRNLICGVFPLRTIPCTTRITGVSMNDNTISSSLLLTTRQTAPGAR